MLRQVNILIAGRVQGVYFRFFTQKKARQLGVKGYVKNLPDGRVDIIAQASNQILEQFIVWCQKGPITARVDQIIVNEQNTDESFDDFTIIR